MKPAKFLVLALVLSLALLGSAEGAVRRKKSSRRTVRPATPPPKTKRVASARLRAQRVSSVGATAASAVSPSGSMSDRIAAIVNQRQLKSTQWSVLVEDLSRGETIYGLNSNSNLLPASNRKLFTTALALDRLGPDYRFTTDLYLAGRKDTEGRFRGNLIVIARGDPTFCARWTKTGRADQRFRDWGDTLVQNGIRYIQGDLIVDISAYEPSERFAAGWKTDQLEFVYSAPVGAFSFNENLVTAVVSAGRSVGSPCRVEFEPHAGDFQVANSATTGRGGGLFITRDDENDILRVKGSMARGAEKRYATMAVAYPGPYSAHALLETLQDRGVRVVGKLQVAEKPVAIDGAERIIRSESEPLSEIIKQVNQDSNNFMAEHVYKAVSLKELGHGSWAGTRQVEAEFLKRCGIDPAKVSFADGCGLSRDNRVSASVIVQLLRAMSKHKYADAFEASLSVSGEKGILKRRLGESLTRGRLHGKTGFLKGVSCLSGYVDRTDGQRLVVSIMTNFNSKEGAYTRIKAQDDICRQILSAPSPR